MQKKRDVFVLKAKDIELTVLTIVTLHLRQQRLNAAEASSCREKTRNHKPHAKNQLVQHEKKKTLTSENESMKKAE